MLKITPKLFVNPTLKAPVIEAYITNITEPIRFNTLSHFILDDIKDDIISKEAIVPKISIFIYL